MSSIAIDEDICIYVQRPFADAFVRRLTRTAVTPNQVTLLRALLGVASAALLTTGLSPLLVLSSVCLILSGILDNVDGQLAAAKGCASLTGRILDGAADGLVFVAIQVGIYFQVSPHIAEAGWAGRAGLVPLIIAVSALQLVGFNLWDFHRQRTRRLIGDRSGAMHRPRAVRQLLRQGGAVPRRVMLYSYLVYCRVQSFLSRDHRTVTIWPPGTKQAALAGRYLRPVARGWSFFGPSTSEVALSLVILLLVFYSAGVWFFLLGLLIVLPPSIAGMKIWTMVVDRRLRTAGII